MTLSILNPGGLAQLAAGSIGVATIENSGLPAFQLAIGFATQPAPYVRFPQQMLEVFCPL